MRFFAHTADDEDGQRLPLNHWQPLSSHLERVAEKAAEFAEHIGLKEVAQLAGLLHDLGKYRDEFQSYLRGERQGGPDTQHAVYGAKWAFNKEHLSTFAVAGHHAGLHNLADLQSLMEKPALHIDDSLPLLVERLEAELGSLPNPTSPPPFLNDDPLAIEFSTRLLFSCLVDADRLDAAFWPHLLPTERHLEAERLLGLVRAERDSKAAAQPESPLRRIRNEIFDACIDRAQLPTGFFSLTVPTGGGKTLSSMAFALKHASIRSMRRVIVVIPYLSIIEQNAAEYRRIFGDNVVLENHSAVQSPSDQTEEEKSRLELLTENWDAQIIVTTSVQFLESLLSASPSRCRKLHRIPGSVVIFDEVQTLPAHLLQPMLSVFRELVRNYHTSFVFCSATQPAFRRCNSVPDGFSTGELCEIAPDPPEIFRNLRRVKYHLPKNDEVLAWPGLADCLASTQQVLCVVNITRHASELWQELKRRLPSGGKPIHLSAAMCPQHRLDLIGAIRKRLLTGDSCRVISTQLIEAGVDVDFPIVWRALGPLDSIVQVAGRCNREGRLAEGEMHVFRPAEHRLPPGVYRAAANQGALTLAGLAQIGEPGDLLSTNPELFAEYFQSLYQVVNTDYARPGEATIQEDRRELRFRRVSEKAKVIDDAGQPVITPYGNGPTVVEHIRNRKVLENRLRFTRDDLRNLQRYMVNVRPRDFLKLQGIRGMTPILPNLEIYVLNEGLYHKDLGLVIENHPMEDFFQ
jgi:CRISPR-associated endonuclease/helicase Cas3